MLASLPRAFGRTRSQELPLGVDFREKDAWVVAGTRTLERGVPEITVTRAFRVELTGKHALTGALEREGIRTATSYRRVSTSPARKNTRKVSSRRSRRTTAATPAS
jgi:hypothetical protein